MARHAFAGAGPLTTTRFRDDWVIDNSHRWVEVYVLQAVLSCIRKGV